MEIVQELWAIDAVRWIAYCILALLALRLAIPLLLLLAGAVGLAVLAVLSAWSWVGGLIERMRAR